MRKVDSYALELSTSDVSLPVLDGMSRRGDSAFVL